MVINMVVPNRRGLKHEPNSLKAGNDCPPYVVKSESKFPT